METILVVEDDLAVQKALRRLFESEDYAVEVKPDGQLDLTPFTSSSSRNRSDLRLPGLPGHDVCREIKKRAPALPSLS
jgi:CheY-like chemotaxis protein